MTALDNLIEFRVNPASTLNGVIRVPSDKSISHRSIMLSSIADGKSRITHFLQGEDAFSTMNAFKAMGVHIEGPDSADPNGEVVVHGVGLYGLQAPTQALDCGNSGTSMRLMAGLLAGQSFASTLHGDASLAKRPMKRVTDPLSLMGASIATHDGGRPPLHISPVGLIGNTNAPLKAIDYPLPMASAQVKSAVLLAGLYAQGTTVVTEPAPTRDHTERMLQAFGVEVKTETVKGVGNEGAAGAASRISLQGGQSLKGTQIVIPADISSAAFFMVAASIAQQADITLLEVGINPTRTGIIHILQAMGANIELLNPRTLGGEPVADIRVQSAQLHGIHIKPEWVPLAIDEFPVLFVAAANAVGTTVLTGAEELRYKESDRIAVMQQGLNALGVNATATPDGMIIEGKGQLSQQNGARYGQATIHAQGDHRIAMSFAVAALRASGPVCIQGAQTVDTSFPGFARQAEALGMAVQVVGVA